jgi:hypothetical protein
LFSLIWRDLTFVTTSNAGSPEFSASASGMTSSASANPFSCSETHARYHGKKRKKENEAPRMAYCSTLSTASAALLTAKLQLISADPPP